MKLSLIQSLGSMRLLSTMGVDEVCFALGCTEKEWEILTSPMHWKGHERPMVQKHLTTLIHAQLDVQGLPRFEVPAEFVAAVIIAFVSPVNYMAACTWLGSFVSNNELANFTGTAAPVEGLERVSPQQIYALICELFANGETTKIMCSYSQKTERQLGYPEEMYNEET